MSSGIASQVLINETQPWILQLGTTQGQFNTLKATDIDSKIAANVQNPHPWNYRLLLNGTLDQLLYDRGRLVTGGLPFPELKKREHINAAGLAADKNSDWSALL